MNEIYLAAHMANDLRRREEGGDNETTVDGYCYFELAATKPIKAGDEIRLNYNLTNK